jgi:putative ABC transport system permease protein
MIPWRRLFRRRSSEAELDEELQSHLNMAAAERRDRGESGEAARTAALREFGNVLLVKEVTREQWGSRWPETLARDLKYTLRQLRKHPGFATTAITMLALGIGANTAVFSVFNQVVLRTLPARNPHQLVLLSHASASDEGDLSGWGDKKLYFSYPSYVALRDGNHTLDSLAASAFSEVNLATGDSADKVNTEYVTGNYFNVLGIRPTLGRLVDPEDDHLHAGNPVAVLSEAYWQTHFHADASILNRVVKINGQPFTIIGVVRFSGLTTEYIPALFVPIAMQPAVMAGRDHGHDRLTDDLFFWITPIGRLKTDITQAQAEQELNALWLDWHRAALVTLRLHHNATFAREWMQTKLSLKDGSQGLRFLEARLGDPLRVLLWMVSIVLIIACGNVANLLLIKAKGRQRELAVQHALGASRWQLFRQTLVEGLLLGAIGSTAGLFLGTVTLRILLGIIPDTNLKSALTHHLDLPVLAFTVFLAIATSILFSLAPALASLHTNPLQALHSGSRAVVGDRSNLHSILVSSEIALSMALLVSAGLVALTLYHLRTIDLGYTTTHLMTFSIDASALGKPEAQVANEYEAIEAELRRLPGVSSVSYASMEILAGGNNNSNITLRGFTGPRLDPARGYVSPGFLSVMQIPLLAGRNFSEHDTGTSQKVAIVDEKFVKHFFHGDRHAALDGQMAWGGGDHVTTDIQIVGIVPAIRSITREDYGPFVYMPYAQSWSNGRSHPANFSIRSSASPAVLGPAIRAAVTQIDHDLPLETLETMQEQVNDSIFQQRLMATLSSTMGALALLLSAIGLYGVLAYAVAQRTQEIAIRIALGASKEDVSRLLLHRMLALVGTGVLAGIPLAWFGTRFLASLATLTGNAVWIYLGSTTLMLVVCGLAAWLPAKKAMSVDPIQVLRAE